MRVFRKTITSWNNSSKDSPRLGKLAQPRPSKIVIQSLLLGVVVCQCLRVGVEHVSLM